MSAVALGIENARPRGSGRASSQADPKENRTGYFTASLAAAAAPALDLAADQRAGGGAENRAGGPRAAGVDRAAEEGAGGAADDEADRAVRAPAIAAAVLAAPGR